MNILVIGGMHGNEPLGLELVSLFNELPQVNIDCIIANPIAVEDGSRFVGVDLNRSFPGNGSGCSYEERRAYELIEICKKFDLVIDFHNTYCPENDCSFVGENAKSELLSVSEYFGLNRAIVADYNCLNKYAPNCISVEVSLDSILNNANYWYQKICRLRSKTVLTANPKLEKYKFVYRMNLEDRDRLKLDSLNLKAFQPIDDTVAGAMGVKSPAYPIFIADKYTPYNYGGLLNKIDV